MTLLRAIANVGKHLKVTEHCKIKIGVIQESDD